MTDIFGRPPVEPWPGVGGQESAPVAPLPDVFDPFRQLGEGAGSFAARMALSRECVRLWRKAWRRVSRARRRQFAEAVLEYASGCLDRFAVQVVSRWLNEPGVWERLEPLVDQEVRGRFAAAVVERAEKALAERNDWDGKPMIYRAMTAAAERELGELARRAALEALTPEED